MASSIREDVIMMNRLRQLFRRRRHTAPVPLPPPPPPAPPEPPAEEAAIQRYLAGGRRPWSDGYAEYKSRFLAQALADAELLETFRTGGRLPSGYGFRLDERAVEFPWTVSRLAGCGRRVLDAGSTLNHPYLLEHPVLKERDLVIYTLAPEGYTCSRANVSYLYGDLRDTILRDGCMDAAACISTLEHVGMDNTMLYTADRTFQECRLTDYLQAVAELRRVLRPGGVALITVPFGKRENHGWTQQFDRRGVQELVRAFGGEVAEWRCYRYLPDGWVTATPDECSGCEYFNIHATPEFGPDWAAAARAVACLRLVRG
jgi:SAM-dependent methyltransferase